MKKTSIGIIVLLIFVALASGCTSQNTQNQTSTKTYAANGISFQYPNSWQEVPPENLTLASGGGNVIAGVYDPGNSDILVIVQTTTATTAKQSFDATKNTINSAGGQILSESTTTVDGTTAYQMDYTITTSIAKKERLIMFEKGKIYALTYSAPQADFDSQLNNFNVIVNSFKVQ
jgi:PsbP-like protein